MQIGKLFIRVIPQARNRGFMLIAGFDSDVNQKTMVKYTTLQAITQEVLDRAQAEIVKMTGAKEVIDVTKPDIYKKLIKLFERQAQVGKWAY